MEVHSVAAEKQHRSRKPCTGTFHSCLQGCWDTTGSRLRSRDRMQSHSCKERRLLAR